MTSIKLMLLTVAGVGLGLSACGGTPEGCGSDTWSSYAEGFFADHCSQCHGSGFETYSLVVGDASSIESAISSGAMPAEGSLSSSDKSRILDWIACGEPE
jgi:hypothetical protein